MHGQGYSNMYSSERLKRNNHLEHIEAQLLSCKVLYINIFITPVTGNCQRRFYSMTKGRTFTAKKHSHIISYHQSWLAFGSANRVDVCLQGLKNSGDLCMCDSQTDRNTARGFWTIF